VQIAWIVIENSPTLVTGEGWEFLSLRCFLGFLAARELKDGGVTTSCQPRFELTRLNIRVGQHIVDPEHEGSLNIRSNNDTLSPGRQGGRVCLHQHLNITPLLYSGQGRLIKTKRTLSPV